MLLNIMQGSTCPCQFYELTLLPELWKGEGSLVGSMSPMNVTGVGVHLATQAVS